ncbi:MAG TPA: dihydropteroate synthase [Rhizomicrobium sp.]|nr:dihydropteroate synthase [Rhizomicrobium sp.]
MTQLFGILNITEDSFSDGGRYLQPDAVLAQARLLARDADVIDLGAASSNPDAKPVAPDVEIARLVPVVAALKKENVSISIDTFSPDAQRWALAQHVDYLNDIRGFPHAELYPDFAASDAKLVVMHAVDGHATRANVPPEEIVGRALSFFDKRITALIRAGISQERLILDPGMGFFLGGNPDASVTMLRALPKLKEAFNLPLFVSVSRKSFVRALAERSTQEAGAATLAAELFAIAQGADYLRTHDPAATRDALKVWAALNR